MRSSAKMKTICNIILLLFRYIGSKYFTHQNNTVFSFIRHKGIHILFLFLGICDQKCRNTPGSYECLCDHKYILQEDKKTCKAVGGEAMMVFSSKTQIRGYFLQSQIYFPVSSQLKQVVGVAYDGTYVYWSDIYSEHESIVKSLEDGSDRQVMYNFSFSLLIYFMENRTIPNWNIHILRISFF